MDGEGPRRRDIEGFRRLISMARWATAPRTRQLLLDCSLDEHAQLAAAIDPGNHETEGAAIMALAELPNEPPERRRAVLGQLDKPAPASPKSGPHLILVPNDE